MPCRMREWREPQRFGLRTRREVSIPAKRRDFFCCGVPCRLLALNIDLINLFGRLGPGPTHVVLRRRADGTFAREDFNYDPASDVYICPGGKTLTTTETRVNTLLYRASKADCDACALRQRCCPNTPARKVPRSVHEKARDIARAIAKSWEGRASRRQRKKVGPQLFDLPLRPSYLRQARQREPAGRRPRRSSVWLREQLREAMASCWSSRQRLPSWINRRGLHSGHCSKPRQPLRLYVDQLIQVRF